MGNLKQRISPTGDTLLYVYDGFLPYTTYSSGTVNGSVHYYIDGDFWLDALQLDYTGTDSLHNIIGYDYDEDGLLTGVYQPTDAWWNTDDAHYLTLTRDFQTGNITGTSLGNVNTSQGYDGYGALSSYEADYGPTPMLQTTYLRDSLGRITEIFENEESSIQKRDYGYDAVGRLVKVITNDTMTSIYSYDANGNRIAHITAAGVDSGTYDAQDRMLRYAGTEYLYTRNGDLQTKISGTDTTKYTYDTFGNLTQVVMPPVPSGNGDVIQYVIDGQNRRIAKKVNGRIVDKWLYAGQLTPVAELDSANNIIARFSGEYMNRKDTVFQMISDYLGCVRLVVNVNTGAIAQKLDYDEFGNVIYDSNPGFQPFGFGGGLYDNDTKLVRYGERDYDPRVGRWIHKDPVGFEDGYDVYAYCENDPINQIDPTGLQTWPGSGRVTSGFGYRVHPITGERRFHNGIDIANPVRAPVLSTEGGTVISTATGPNGEDQIIIRNDDGSISGYAHTDPSVTVGQHVYEGEPIGVTDLSGLSTGGHVHYTYRSAKGQPHTNPLYHLPKANNYHRLLPCHNGFKGSSSGTSFWNSLVTYLRVQLGV